MLSITLKGNRKVTCQMKWRRTQQKGAQRAQNTLIHNKTCTCYNVDVVVIFNLLTPYVHLISAPYVMVKGPYRQSSLLI